MKFYPFFPFLIILISSHAALATHEVDHRFTVYGYVRDAQGRPVADARVVVVEKKEGSGKTAFTDSDGYYEALLHIHNDQLGEELIVTVSDSARQVNETKRMIIQFDPEDKVTERRSRLDFGPEGREKNGWVAYGVGALLVVGGITFWRMSMRRFRGKGKPGKNKGRERGKGV